MENQEEKASLCALNRIFGFEPKKAIALISALGNASNIFRLTKNDLDEMLGPYSRYAGMITPKSVDEAAKELETLEKQGIRFTGLTEEEYPSFLKECPDAPIGLYIRSSTPASDLFSPKRKIAIIGTRDLSSYGKEWCEKTIQALADSKENPLIISGLALGADICAHKAAIEAGLPTIGVMATGPESIYPHRNRDTAIRMTEIPGCGLITDYPPGTVPLAIHFLRRNRIIAGLTEATILIESRIKGGGMMTSRLAFSYGREVYALPGRVDDACSSGCNRLLREKIAEPLTSPADLLESLGMKYTYKSKGTNIEARLEEIFGTEAGKEEIQVMRVLLSHIRKNRGITIEELSYKTETPYRQTFQTCSRMESEGIISTDLLQRCSIIDKKH